MRNYKVILALFCGAAGSLTAQNSGYYNDFNGSAADLADNFVKPYDLGPLRDLVTWGANVGVGGSGGLNVVLSGVNRTFYYQSTFDLLSLSAGEVITSTADFLWANSTATTLTGVAIGFTNDAATNGIVARDGATTVRILRNGSNEVGLHFREGQSNTKSLLFSQGELDVGSWYRLSYTLTKVGADAYNYEVALYTLGTTGLDLPVLFTFGAENTPALISGAVGATGVENLNKDALYFGYLARSDDGNGISHLDNFAVAIPEPSTWAMIAGLGGLGLAALNRRKVS